LIATWLAPEWIQVPMRALMGWLIDFTGSYGFAIILLTLAVRIVILPLTIYQTKSMKRMQEVQPLMKEIQTKYKDQPEKMNQEMMALYKTERVNPFSGCLPLVIQMPFLYAIFSVLQHFVVPGHVSPGFLWMADLGKADPLFVLPALTVASMFVQSWLTGGSTDPNQKMMMYMMPLLFGWFTFKMPAGVVLYWVISTVFGLIQQAIYPGFPRFKGAPGAKGEAGAR
jgi:YidC/Oxa1 family membrane protein insertase